MSKKDGFQNLIIGVVLGSCLAFFIGILVNATYEGLRKNFSIDQIFWPSLFLTYFALFWLFFILDNYDDLGKKSKDWKKLFISYFYSNHKIFFLFLVLIMISWFSWLGIFYAFADIWDSVFKVLS